MSFYDLLRNKDTLHQFREEYVLLIPHPIHEDSLQGMSLDTATIPFSQSHMKSCLVSNPHSLLDAIASQFLDESLQLMYERKHV